MLIGINYAKLEQNIFRVCPKTDPRIGHHPGDPVHSGGSGTFPPLALNIAITGPRPMGSRIYGFPKETPEKIKIH